MGRVLFPLVSSNEPEAILAAGEVMLAHFNGTAFQVSYILGSITGLLIAAAMLRSNIFSWTTAYLGWRRVSLTSESSSL